MVAVGIHALAARHVAASVAARAVLAVHVGVDQLPARTQAAQIASVVVATVERQHSRRESFEVPMVQTLQQARRFADGLAQANLEQALLAFPHFA